MHSDPIMSTSLSLQVNSFQNKNPVSIEKNQSHLKKFTIPNRNKARVKTGILDYIDLTSQIFLHDLKPKLEASCKNASHYEHFRINRAWLVNNDAFLKEYVKVKRKMKTEQNYSDKETIDSFAFLYVENYTTMKDYCHNGARINMNLNFDSCGDPKLGVHMSRFYDILTNKPLSLGNTGYILIFKLIKGKAKILVQPNNQLEPTPNFDCHQLRDGHLDLFNLTPHQAFRYAQIYAYGYDDDMEVMKRPAQLCPYAVVNFTFIGPSFNYNNRSNFDLDLRRRRSLDIDNEPIHKKRSEDTYYYQDLYDDYVKRMRGISQEITLEVNDRLLVAEVDRQRCIQNKFNQKQVTRTRSPPLAPPLRPISKHRLLKNPFPIKANEELSVEAKETMRMNRRLLLEQRKLNGDEENSDDEDDHQELETIRADRSKEDLDSVEPPGGCDISIKDDSTRNEVKEVTESVPEIVADSLPVKGTPQLPYFPPLTVKKDNPFTTTYNSGKVADAIHAIAREKYSHDLDATRQSKRSDKRPLLPYPKPKGNGFKINYNHRSSQNISNNDRRSNPTLNPNTNTNNFNNRYTVKDRANSRYYSNNIAGPSNRLPPPPPPPQHQPHQQHHHQYMAPSVSVEISPSRQSNEPNVPRTFENLPSEVMSLDSRISTLDFHMSSNGDKMPTMQNSQSTSKSPISKDDISNFSSDSNTEDNSDDEISDDFADDIIKFKK